MSQKMAVWLKKERKLNNMLLGFKERFKEPILKGTKIHTIREDKHHRWQAGKLIHFAIGVRTKKYNQFYEKLCTGTRHIEIDPVEKKVFIIVNGTEQKYFNSDGIETLAKNDGFKNVNEFWAWFNKPFVGKIIYWTDFKY